MSIYLEHLWSFIFSCDWRNANWNSPENFKTWRCESLFVCFIFIQFFQLYCCFMKGSSFNFFFKFSSTKNDNQGIHPTSWTLPSSSSSPAPASNTSSEGLFRPPGGPVGSLPVMLSAVGCSSPTRAFLLPASVSAMSPVSWSRHIRSLWSAAHVLLFRGRSLGSPCTSGTSSLMCICPGLALRSSERRFW